MFLSFQGHSLEAQPKTAGEFHLLGWIWGGRILTVKYVNIELGIAFNAWNMSASIIRLRQHMWLIFSGQMQGHSVTIFPCLNPPGFGEICTTFNHQKQTLN